MSMTDPIADMLTRIRNAARANHGTVTIPASRMKLAIAKILKDEGFISAYKVGKDDKQKAITIVLKYGGKREPSITNLQRVSKPGRRVYYKKGEIPKVLGGFGIAILSTSRGIMTDKSARKEGVGGELLCTIY